MDRKLILIKHSLPTIEHNVPASRWHLSHEGQLLCTHLANKLRTYTIVNLTSSNEPKAMETARLLAEQLGLQAEVAEGLHEHDRSNLPYLSTEEFQLRVAGFFRQPKNLLMGLETADQALVRFSQAVLRVIAKKPGGNLAIVAHGTVITLFVAQHATIDPFTFWQRLGLPSFVVLSLPDFRLLEVVDSVVPADEG